jgi:hypothetical protein
VTLACIEFGFPQQTKRVFATRQPGRTTFRHSGVQPSYCEVQPPEYGMQPLGNEKKRPSDGLHSLGHGVQLPDCVVQYSDCGVQHADFGGAASTIWQCGLQQWDLLSALWSVAAKLQGTVVQPSHDGIFFPGPMALHPGKRALPPEVVTPVCG